MKQQRKDANQPDKTTNPLGQTKSPNRSKGKRQKGRK